METLAMLDHIQTLVSDNLQVVSYKWLSRNFLVSSNAAKRLLQQFVQTHGNGLEVVYSLSGWLKTNPSNYHIKLVSAPKLEEAKQEFDGNCSVQVYSVQACIPKDPAMLWNAEFIQAEELSRQPFTVDNCLRDNRFCGILNSIVKRHVDGTSVSTADPQAKTMGLPVLSTSNSTQKSISVSTLQPTKATQSSPQVHQQLPNVVKDVKTNITGADSHDQLVKLLTDTENVPALPADRKQGQNDKISSGNGGSLANLWGRASTKLKPTSPVENNLTASTANAEDQIHAQEAIQDLSSDDEAHDFNFRRASNGEGSRKRRVVLDYSDDEGEEAVNLSSPELPKGKLSETIISEKPSLKEQTLGKCKVKEEESTKSSDQHASKDFSGVSKGVDPKISSVKNDRHHAQDAIKENIAANNAPASPKRRKVLKTRIDERGREVTEVVWEGEEVAEKKKVEDNSTTRAENNPAIANTVNSRQPAVKKSPAVGNTASSNTGAKAGNKKGVNKDPKQGNIMSFFKRV